MNNISQSPSQALVSSEPVTERNGGVDAAVAAEAANKTLATQGEVELPSAPPPEPFELVSASFSATHDVGEVGESFHAENNRSGAKPGSPTEFIDTPEMPEFLRRTA